MIRTEMLFILEVFQNELKFQRRQRLLIHLGYLGYDAEQKEAFIPNKEIIGEFENAMIVCGWPEVMRVLKASEAGIRR